jgi:indolepyruvate ferredoxin oxidoreductase beta subunit
MGVAKYPEDIESALQEKIDILEFKAADVAKELGNLRVMNVVLLGALVKAMGIEGIDWDEVIRGNVKKGFDELNIKAFHAGYAI